ncbi:DUF4190 domain-containing protein [Streptomyces sp. ASQP_92]|uniref:DUF4190 domain-containing protein n=1 Tax=unclassified Streptomyces TaxID=2593676 RepID=UPI0021C21D22|nr:DUF4190 domain-containing protein [Streptomyces sp. ASQP_92]MCT9091104.1 DUF4190 domain-containing protein [Streptomyces sp. ASQP_92]
MEIPPPPAPGQPPQPQPGQGYGWPAPHQAPGGQPGPYPGQPMNTGPWYPYPAAPQRPPVSGLAIGSLIAGILCCIPPLGLILGAFALGQIKKKGQRGKGMAITGLVLSTISTVLLAVTIASGGFADGWRDFKDGWNDSVANSRDTVDLRKGDCFDVPGGKLEREVVSVRIVPCAGKHDAEVSGSFRLTDTSFPGQSAIAAQADSKCWKLEQAYAMDRWKVPADAEAYYYTPSSRSWGQGDHSVTCAFASEHGKLTGSVRNDITTLDADQVAFLDALNALDRVMAEAPDEDRVEDDLPGFNKWAIKVSGTMDAYVGILAKHAWPARVSGSVQPYIDGMRIAQKEWLKAASALDADAYYLHSGAADAAMKQSVEIAARGALGLATTPPSTDDRSGGGSGGGGGTGGSTGGGSGSDGSKSV